MAASLPTIPVELIELVTGHLAPADLSALRLACSELNTKSFRCFSRICFTTLQTDLSRASLQRLEHIAAHAGLAGSVQTLVIKGAGPHMELGRGYAWRRHRTGRLAAAQPGAVLLRDLLLTRLLSCRSFRVVGDRSIYEWPLCRKPDCVEFSDALAIILSMVAETGLRIKSLYVDFMGSGPLGVNMKRQHVQQYALPGFEAGWACLQELYLECTLGPDTAGWEADLVQRASGLRKLRLHTLSLLHETLVFERLTSAAVVPSLEELSLGRMRIPADVLSRFVLRFCHSLRALEFFRVSLERRGGCSDTWVTALEKWKGCFPLLQRFSVVNVAISEDDRRFDLHFPALLEDPVVPGTGGQKFLFTGLGRGRLSGVSYQGPGMDAALETLAKAATWNQDFLKRNA